MCAVILIHCQAQGHTVLAEYYQIVFRQVINFAVAVFIFMAGYFARPYKMSGGSYWNRLKKLLIPYILWSVFYSAVNGSGPDLSRIVYDLLTGRAQAQLYYIVVLVELTLITPLLMKALDKRKWSVIILTITPIYLILSCGYRYVTGAELAWMGRDFCSWIIFYYTGMLIKHYGWSMKKQNALLTAYILTLLVSITEGMIVNFKLGMFSMAIGQINVITMLYSLTVIALIMNCWAERQEKSVQKYVGAESGYLGLKYRIRDALVYIGNISFGIYFCHTFVLRCVNFVLKRIGIMDVFPLPLIQLTQFSLILIGSVAGIYIFHRIDEKRKICPYIGF